MKLAKAWLKDNSNVHISSMSLRLDLLNVVNQAAICSTPSKQLLMTSKQPNESGSQTPPYARNSRLIPGSLIDSHRDFESDSLTLSLVAKNTIRWTAAILEYVNT